MYNLSKTSIIQNSLSQGHEIKLAGLVYDLKEGLLKDLKVDTRNFSEFEDIYNFAQQDANSEG